MSNSLHIHGRSVTLYCSNSLDPVMNMGRAGQWNTDKDSHDGFMAPGIHSQDGSTRRYSVLFIVGKAVYLQFHHTLQV